MLLKIDGKKLTNEKHNFFWPCQIKMNSEWMWASSTLFSPSYFLRSVIGKKSTRFSLRKFPRTKKKNAFVQDGRKLPRKKNVFDEIHKSFNMSWDCIVVYGEKHIIFIITSLSSSCFLCQLYIRNGTTHFRWLVLVASKMGNICWMEWKYVFLKYN